MVATGLLTVSWEKILRRSFRDEILHLAKIPVETEDAGLERICSKFQDVTDWSRFFGESDQLDLFVCEAQIWGNLNQPYLKEFLTRKKTKLRVILPDPEREHIISDLAASFGCEPEYMRSKIQEAARFFEGIAPSGKKVEIWYFTGMSPKFTLFIFRNRAVLSLLNHNYDVQPEPALVFNTEGDFFPWIQEQFEVIHARSRRIFPTDKTELLD